MWLLFAVTFLYFLPFFVGLFRNHPHPIFLFTGTASLGWTGWGWVACFVYSLWTFVQREPVPVSQVELIEGPDDDPEPFSVTELVRLQRLRDRGRGQLIEFPIAKVSRSMGR
jgi:hypothetical protein